MSDLAVNNYEIINEFLTLKWTNGDESYIPLKKLRENCPCATCSGETDALGNLHKGLQPALNPASYQLLNLDQWVITLYSHFGEMDTIPGFTVSNCLGN